MGTIEELNWINFWERVTQNLRDQEYGDLNREAYNAGLINKEEAYDEKFTKEELVEMFLQNEWAIPDVYKED